MSPRNKQERRTESARARAVSKGAALVNLSLIPRARVDLNRCERIPFRKTREETFWLREIARR